MPAYKTRSPGRILSEDYLPRLPEHLRDQSAVANRLQISRRRWNEILNGRRAITPDTALRLGRFFGTGPEFWLGAQARWELQEEMTSRSKRTEIEGIQPAPLEHAEQGGGEQGWVASHGNEELSDEGQTLRLAAVLQMARAPQVEGETATNRERYYREFLEKKGMLREGQRYVNVRSEVDAVQQRPSPRGLPLSVNYSLPLFVGGA